MLNAVLVPQITKAEKNPDGGKDFVDRLLTLAIVGLLVVTLVCLAGAPLLVRVFSSDTWPEQQFALSVAFAYICMPAIFFYGIYTILGQVLNARERFGWFMWSPVLCNVVWIVGLGWFMQQHGRGVGSPGAYTAEMIWLLAGSLVLGVAAQALVLLVPLYRGGFRYTPGSGGAESVSAVPGGSPCGHSRPWSSPSSGSSCSPGCSPRWSTATPESCRTTRRSCCS